MFLFKFLSKISLLLFLLIFIGLPILNPYLLLVFFILSVFIITGKIRKINLYSITVTIISFIAVLSTLSFSFPQIHEGHNYLFFIGKDSAYLKEALPYKVYNLSKERYDKGVTILESVLNTQRQYNNIRSQYISLSRQRIDNRLSLFLALGGDSNKKLK